jgi:hypothetical protein
MQHSHQQQSQKQQQQPSKKQTAQQKSEKEPRAGRQRMWACCQAVPWIPLLCTMLTAGALIVW